MPLLTNIVSAISSICSASESHYFTTIDVIKYFLGDYYCNISTPAIYSYNAKIGKLINTIPGVTKIRTIRVKDANGRSSHSAYWHK